MIVRDEEDHLGACLATLQGVVDEIVIVDTGSTDGSVAVAESFGARVHREPWVDDFSAARNAALDRAQGQWILYIDADERLRPVARTDVVALLESAPEVAFRVLLRPFVGATPCREFRLWRNDPRIRFEGVIHEKVAPAIQAVADADGRPIGRCDLELEHLGYEGDQQAKHRRNLPLLRAQLAAEPGNVFNWRHLAVVLAALGHDDEAEDAWARALQLVRERAGPTGPPGGALVYADLVRLRHQQHGAGAATALLDEAQAAYPDDPLVLWARATVALDTGEPDVALASLDRLAAVDPTTLDDTLSYAERLWGVFVHRARGLAHFRLGRYDDAAAAYREAEALDPDSDEDRARRRMCEHLGGRARTEHR